MGNKSYRIRTNVDKDKFVHVQLDQDYDTLEILSLKIGQEQYYRLHTSNYGIIVGRVVANGGVGVPNAKISIFIAKTETSNAIYNHLYPYSDTSSVNDDGIRYNLLPEEKVNDCHNPVGTFPSKSYMLDNDSVLDIFEDYYRYTTKTNDAGDYMIVGVPTGQQTLHMDLDLSDCGMLSQRPYDFLYKGYNIEQFENANQFKTSKTLEELSQIFTQDQTVDVKPFWGDTSDSATEEIGITRADIDVNFKFETTCVFIGSVFSDDTDNGLSKRCLPRKKMGKMEKLSTGEGTIEIIRKRTNYSEGESTVEELQIKGTQLIDGDGTWCFQIPMNLDYMITDEYGNLIPTDNPERGIATRTRVRFRISMNNENTSSKYFQAKVLVPNNPQSQEDYQTTYIFGSKTEDKDFKDLFWQNVYTVKSYIPRLQHTNILNNRSKRFTGIKTTNIPESNNPFPYNHIRIQFPFYYTLICFLIHIVTAIVTAFNSLKTMFNHLLQKMYDVKIAKIRPFKFVKALMFNSYTTISGSFCPELADKYFVPGALVNNTHYGHTEVKDLYGNTFKKILQDNYPNLTGNSRENLVIDSGNIDGAYVQPLISGNTLYGYYCLKQDKDTKVYTSITYLVGQIWKQGYTVNTDSSKVQEVDIQKKDFKVIWGLYLTGDNLDKLTGSSEQNKLITIAREVVTAETIDKLNMSILRPTYSNFKGGVSGGKAHFTYYKALTYTEIDDFSLNKVDTYLGLSGVSVTNTALKCAAEYRVEKAEIDESGNTSIISATTTYNGYTSLITELINTINSGVLSKYDGDINSIEYASSNQSSSAETADTICIYPKTDYLTSCIEYNLAEELDMINFDFYNDWINGAIYMPRWARVVKVRRISGKTRLRACSDDTKSPSGRYGQSSIAITEMSPIIYNADGQAPVIMNAGFQTWKDRAISSTINSALIHSEKYSTVDSTSVYYYIPAAFSNKKRTAILFATDIVLLGSLNECNIYGIPSDFSGYLPSTHQLPPELATTNSISDDGSILNMGDGGCLTTKEINGQSNSTIWNYFVKSMNQTTTQEDISGEYIPATEESGIVWFYSKIGPNQTASKKTNTNWFYNPGGQFLAISCLEDYVQTSLKSNVNLLRACELGVSLSERQEITRAYDSDTGDYKDIYIVPNGLISKNEIYNHSVRAMFATLNYNQLKTKIDEPTGYLRYDFSYMNPYSFGGEYSSVLDNYGDRYNATIKIRDIDNSYKLADAETIAQVEWEKEHTYSRANEDASNDYLMYRYGGEYRNYIGDSLRTKDAARLLWKFSTAVYENILKDILTRIGTETLNTGGYIPQFENSYYFYFGLRNGSTALDKFKASYEAVCSKQETVNYHGSLDIATKYTTDCKDEVEATITIVDAESPYEITINGAVSGNFGLYKQEDDELVKIEGNTVTNYTANTIYAIVDPDITTDIKVTGSDGFIITSTIVRGKWSPEDYSYRVVNFIGAEARSETEVDEYGTLVSSEGGYIAMNIPFDDMLSGTGVFSGISGCTLEFRIGDDPAVIYGCGHKEENATIIEGENGWKYYPVNSAETYTVVAVQPPQTSECSGNNDTYLFENIVVSVDNPRTLYLYNRSNEYISLSAGSFTMNDGNIGFIANNMVQYSDTYDQISLSVRSDTDMDTVVVGQGEHYNLTTGDEKVDTNWETEGTTIATTNEESMISGYSANLQQTYLPTINGKLERKNYSAIGYTNTKVYPYEPIVSITNTYVGKDAYEEKNEMQYISVTASTEIPLKQGDVVLFRQGTKKTGVGLIEVPCTVDSCENNTATLYTGRQELIEINSGYTDYPCALFKMCEVPIYYIDQRLSSATITMSNYIETNKIKYYVTNAFIDYNINNWYSDKNLLYSQNKDGFGYKVNNGSVYKLNPGKMSDSEILAGLTQNFFDVQYTTIEYNGNQALEPRKNGVNLELTTGEIINGDINGNGAMVFDNWSSSTTSIGTMPQYSSSASGLTINILKISGAGGTMIDDYRTGSTSGIIKTVYYDKGSNYSFYDLYSCDNYYYDDPQSVESPRPLECLIYSIAICFDETFGDEIYQSPQLLMKMVGSNAVKGYRKITEETKTSYEECSLYSIVAPEEAESSGEEWEPEISAGSSSVAVELVYWSAKTSYIATFTIILPLAKPANEGGVPSTGDQQSFIYSMINAMAKNSDGNSIKACYQNEDKYDESPFVIGSSTKYLYNISITNNIPSKESSYLDYTNKDWNMKKTGEE